MQNFKKKLKQILIKKSVINKKLTAAVLALNLLSVYPACGMITDNFAEATLDKSLKIKPYKPKIYRDEFTEANKSFAPTRIYKKVYLDEFAEANKNITPKNYTKKSYYDEFAETNHKVAKHSVRKIRISETNNPNIIFIRILKPLSTKSKPEEGSPIDFVTTKEVKINNKIYPAGTPVKARVETVSQNSIWGVPADLIVGNFYIDNIPINGEIKKTGANNTLWVKPLSIACGILVGAGFLFLFIRGGHAKIKPNETFTLSF